MFKVLLQPFPVFVSVSCIVDDEVFFAGHSEDCEVVDYSALGIAQEGVLALADWEGRNIVGGESVQEALSVFSFDGYSPHVGDIEESNVVADSFALGDDAFEPDGEIEASVIDESAMFFMILVNRCLLSQFWDSLGVMNFFCWIEKGVGYVGGIGVWGIIFKVSVSKPSFFPHLGQ